MTNPSSGAAPPPLALRIAAVVAIAYGTIAAVDTLTSLVRGEFLFNLGFLGIPIGSGLLQGRESTRLWAVSLSFLALFATICLYTWLLAGGQQREIAPAAEWTSFIPSILSCLVYATLFLTLRMARVRAWFSLKTFERSSMASPGSRSR